MIGTGKAYVLRNGDDRKGHLEPSERLSHHEVHLPERQADAASTREHLVRARPELRPGQLHEMS